MSSKSLSSSVANTFNVKSVNSIITYIAPFLLFAIGIYVLSNNVERFTVFNAYNGESPPFTPDKQVKYQKCKEECPNSKPGESVVACERKCRKV